jgi:hypothetical protein
MQHAKHMRRVILSSVACLALPYFVTLSRKGTIFGGEKIEQKSVGFIFYTILV